VNVVPQATTPVAFRLNCPAVGARVTLATTGLDIDHDGYRITVDGTDRAPISSNAVAFVRAQPGSRTIALTGLAPNCTSAGPDSRTVTIAPDQVTPVEFAVVCTATTGVIELSLSGPESEVGGGYQVAVDGLWETQPLAESEPVGIFVSGGDHLVQLAAPGQCTVVPATQSVKCDRRRVRPGHGRAEFRGELHSVPLGLPARRRRVTRRGHHANRCECAQSGPCVVTGGSGASPPACPRLTRSSIPPRSQVEDVLSFPRSTFPRCVVGRASTKITSRGHL
jgi:hypothetical protein